MSQMVTRHVKRDPEHAKEALDTLQASKVNSATATINPLLISLGDILYCIEEMLEMFRECGCEIWEDIVCSDEVMSGRSYMLGG